MEEGSLFQRMKNIFQVEDEKLDEGMQKEAAVLIRNIFRYMDKDAKDIMTHRKNIAAIDEEELLEDALHFMLEENYSRFPIYHEDIDEITGFLHLREAVSCYLNENLRKVPEKIHIVVVLDEYGQTSGLVAMEDILEEIVGNILDEYDEEEQMVAKLADGSYAADGMTDLEDLGDLLNIPFEKDEYETLNGFLVDKLDRIPQEDESCEVEYEGYLFTVLSVDNNIIQRVKIEKQQKE